VAYIILMMLNGQSLATTSSRSGHSDSTSQVGVPSPTDIRAADDAVREFLGLTTL
jgi:hypothetical protein